MAAAAHAGGALGLPAAGAGRAGEGRVLAPVADLLNHASHAEGAGEAEEGSQQGLELGRSTPPAAKMELHARGDSPRHWHSAAGAGGESDESLPLSDEAFTLVATREVSAGEEVHPPSSAPR